MTLDGVQAYYAAFHCGNHRRDQGWGAGLREAAKKKQGIQ